MEFVERTDNLFFRPERINKEKAPAQMSDFDYDLFVIGGGSGGVRAARLLRVNTGPRSPSPKRTGLCGLGP